MCSRIRVLDVLGRGFQRFSETFGDLRASAWDLRAFMPLLQVLGAIAALTPSSWRSSGTWRSKCVEKGRRKGGAVAAKLMLSLEGSSLRRLQAPNCRAISR